MFCTTRCILSKFYIKPQLNQTSTYPTLSCILSKFYIKPQLLALRCLTSAVVSYRNSTSNHNICYCRWKTYTLYLIEILHQTTTWRRSLLCFPRCILSKFYIKPQRRRIWLIKHLVVSYRNSTSNHNLFEIIIATRRLYLIEILHQTTTRRPPLLIPPLLYLIEILHQTTTVGFPGAFELLLYLIEILHQTTTVIGVEILAEKLYLIEILHQTTTLFRAHQ